ncbi:hypothetical protein BASA84_000763 [Batrachochytrium salamandrivorans]|nr:hypothetical protein BASA84_000763 [Batrachochytrium salamandrivorans]
MPLYTGQEINLPNLHIPNATSLLQRLSKHSNEGIQAFDGSLGGQNIRVANRRIVITMLKKSLAFDGSISCFDINRMASIMAVCVNRVIHIWDIETYILKNSFGKPGRNPHNGAVLSCCINLVGGLLATGGNDKCITVWSVEKGKGLKTIVAHKGAIYQVEFSADSDYIYSSSDDGHVLKWDWRAGTLLSTCMRHPSAVRSFDFNFGSPDTVVCGRADGHITVWNAQSALRIDNIMPDPEWMHSKMESNLLAWSDSEKNHSGSVLCVRLSPNGRFLATGATDNTCKIWRVASYSKHLDTVQRELSQTDLFQKKLNGYIDIMDTSYDEQLKYQEYSTLKIGDVPLTSGYHADLLSTLRHEAPVLCVRFTCNSELWSSRRGELLFQINTPAPVTMIQVDILDHIYLSCQNRLLIFGIKALFKENDLPQYWQAPETRPLVPQPKTQVEPILPTIEPPKPLSPKNVSIGELRRLIAHGLALPRLLESLVSQFHDIDKKQLESNMRRHNANSSQLLRLITSSRFHPQDILKALSAKGNVTVLYSLISYGGSITGYMLKLGFKQSDDGHEHHRIQIDDSDFQAPVHGKGHDYYTKNIAHGDFDPETWWQDWHHPFLNNESDEDGYDEENDGFGVRSSAQPKGKVLHFIPSIQMKLLKDLQAKRAVKPIFLRQLALETEQGRPFPNFDLQDRIIDQRPILPKHSVTKQGVRFNESIIGHNSMQHRKDDPRPLPLNEYASWKGSLSSSRTLFKPERYFQTRGLNISFDRREGAAESTVLPGSNESQGYRNVTSEPILIKRSRDRDESRQLVVGLPTKFSDSLTRDVHVERTLPDTVVHPIRYTNDSQGSTR